MNKQLQIVAAISAVAALPASAAISIIGQTNNSVRNSNFDTAFDATGADKLVVVVTGEHGFNNAAGTVTSLTYDGVDLVPAAYRDAVTSQTDILYHGIFYLDNPVTTTGTVNLQSQNRGTISIFALTGTAEGVGATGITAVGSRTIDLTTTTAGSLVFSAIGLGGDGNTGNTNSVDPDAPAVEVAAVKDPSNWQGHVVATAEVTTPGSTTYGFTGGTATGAVVSAAEFLAADPIPEPSGALLLGLGALGALGFRRRK